MTRALLTLAAFALMLEGAALLGATSGRADANAAVCATINSKGGGSTTCNFATFAQCQATVSGLAGSCSANPAFQDSQNRAQPRRRSAR